MFRPSVENARIFCKVKLQQLDEKQTYFCAPLVRLAWTGGSWIQARPIAKHVRGQGHTKYVGKLYFYVNILYHMIILYKNSRC